MNGLSQANIRERSSQSIQVGANLTLTACSSYPNFVPSSFRIDILGKCIYIDPYRITDPRAADYIFITHAHPDHLSLPDIAQIVKPETRIVCPRLFVQALSRYRVQKVQPGDVVDLGDLQCEVVPAYNRWVPMHLKLFRFVGYILTLSGARLYHAGDTDFIPEMRKFTAITVALVPIGIRGLAMNPQQAAAAVNVIRPLIAIPMHYALGKNQAETFRLLVDKDIQVISLEGKPDGKRL